jgi:peptidoglycan/xylan/chitin deacetylase (PgdA/CDA1 family)
MIRCRLSNDLNANEGQNFYEQGAMPQYNYCYGSCCQSCLLCGKTKPFLLTLPSLSAILAHVMQTCIIPFRYARVSVLSAAILLLGSLLSACAQATPGGPNATTGSTARATEVRGIETSPAAPFTVTPVTTSTRTIAPSAAPSRTPKPTATNTAAPTATPSPTATPGPTPDGAARSLRLPILMYHYVSRPPTDADAYRRDLSVSPEQFREHLAYLKDAGYSAVTLDDLLYALAQGRALPPKPVVLTFDDGYRDNYENAFPALREAGFTATFFIITDFVTEQRPEYMNWGQIEAMAAAGQQFGSHSRNHPNLAGQSIDYLVWQALGSKEAIEARLGQTPRWVAYPSGKYDPETIAVFRSAGFWGGVTIQQGTEHTLDGIFNLKRIRVRGSHTPADLARLLALDW